MTRQEFEAQIVGKIKYKPNWRFDWEIRPDPPAYRCCVQLRTVSSDPRKHFMNERQQDCYETAVIQNTWVFSFEDIETHDAEWYKAHIFDCIMAMEEHEAKEWYRINGQQIYDPHDGR